MAVLGTIAQIAVGVVFLWAAAAKLLRWRDLPDWLAAYGTPRRAAAPLAAALMVAEATVGTLLLAGAPSALPRWPGSRPSPEASTSPHPPGRRSSPSPWVSWQWPSSSSVCSFS